VIEHTDLFKHATGGDLIRAEFKFRDAFSFRCYALPLFSANELPRTADQTDAWFDRWIIIRRRSPPPRGPDLLVAFAGAGRS
jgi:phage/plasmid-associated DNA primase